MQYKTSLLVSFQLEGFHNWPEVESHFPEVDFLKHRHRHMFHFRAEKAVTHDDRDLELIMLKREMIAYIKDRYAKYEGDEVDPLIYETWLEFGAMSCEMIAKELVKNFGLESCEVLEDGENGARVTRQPLDLGRATFIAGMAASGKETFIKNHLGSSHHIKISDHVREMLKAESRPAETTSDLNDTKDLDEAVARSIWQEMLPILRDTKKHIVLDGPRQVSIIRDIGHKMNARGESWGVVWLNVNENERQRRYKKRNRTTDNLLSLSEVDDKNIALGVHEVREYATQMKNGIVIEN